MKRKKKALRIAAGITAFIIIGGILFVTNAFVGNPISYLMAKRGVERYVAQNYSFLDLELEKPVYNFKYPAYMVRAKSRTSMDTHFGIYYRNGKVEWDDYQSNVLGLFNTAQRLSDEYSALARTIISSELGYSDNRTSVLYTRDESENYGDVLQLDMKFDRKIPLKAEVTVHLDIEEHSLEAAARVLEEAHRAFIRNDCHFNIYSFYSEDLEGFLIMINGVSPEDIEGGELVNLLKQAEASQDGALGSISVFIK